MVVAKAFKKVSKSTTFVPPINSLESLQAFEQPPFYANGVLSSGGVVNTYGSPFSDAMEVENFKNQRGINCAFSAKHNKYEF